MQTCDGTHTEIFQTMTDFRFGLMQMNMYGQIKLLGIGQNTGKSPYHLPYRAHVVRNKRTIEDDDGIRPSSPSLWLNNLPDHLHKL